MGNRLDDCGHGWFNVRIIAYVFLTQVVLANKGDIDAVFSYIHSQSMFGPLFTFSPSQGIVRPGGYQAVKVSLEIRKIANVCMNMKYQNKEFYS